MHQNSTSTFVQSVSWKVKEKKEKLISYGERFLVSDQESKSITIQFKFTRQHYTVTHTQLQQQQQQKQ